MRVDTSISSVYPTLRCCYAGRTRLGTITVNNVILKAEKTPQLIITTSLTRVLGLSLEWATI